MVCCVLLVQGTIYRLNVKTGKLTVWGYVCVYLPYAACSRQLFTNPSVRSSIMSNSEIVVKGFDPSIFKTEQIFYKSKDGTTVPMFITSRKDLVLDGSNPTILYGYGGFNISLPPAFSVSVLTWLQHFNGGRARGAVAVGLGCDVIRCDDAI